MARLRQLQRRKGHNGNERRSRISATRKTGGKLHMNIANTFCSCVLRGDFCDFPWKNKNTLPKKYLQQLYLKWRIERRRKAVACCNIEPNLVVILQNFLSHNKTILDPSKNYTLHKISFSVSFSQLQQ